MDLPDHAVLSLLAAAGLATVHLLSQQLRILDGIPRSRLLSAAGGLAVAFVAIRLLPAVAAGDQRLRAAIDDTSLRFVDDTAPAQPGRVLRPGTAGKTLGRQSPAGSRRDHDSGVWLHMATFSVMNALIGCLLLHNQERSGATMLAFFVAMLVKFVVNDHGLHNLHQDRYDER